MNKERQAPDYILIVATIVLLSVGLIMVYSASEAWATYRFNDSLFFLLKDNYSLGV